MKMKTRSLAMLSVLFLLGGCATLPNGPSVLVLPGTGKGFEQFQTDNLVCRQYAREQVGIAPQQAARQSTLETAGVGALLGTAIGAAAGHGRGAVIGAAGGALAGAAVGSGAGAASAEDAQQRYDNAYMQCMYAKGNQIPMAGESSGAYPPPPPPPSGGPYAPPPPGPGQSYPPPGTPPPPGVAPPG